MNDWGGFFTALVTVAPAVLGGLGVFLTRERQPRLYRNVQRQADLLAKLTSGSTAHAEMQTLLDVTTKALRERETVALERKLNPANLVLSIVLAAGSGVAIYFLVIWSAATAGTPLGVVAMIATVLVGLFLALLVGASFTILYNPPSPKKAKV